MAKKIDKLFSDMAIRGTRSTSKRRMFNAYNWYRKRTDKIAKVNRKDLLKTEGFTKRTKPMIGGMYSYFYDPKMKKELPFYDRFPLILMVAPTKGGWYGCNLHYLSPRLRAILMDELMKIAKAKKVGKMQRVQLTYNMLHGASKLSAFQPCFKKYLSKHLVTPPTEIPFDDWEKVLFLPTESFVGASKNYVWKNSQNQI